MGTKCAAAHFVPIQNKYMEIAGAILEVLYAWGRMLPRPFESKYAWGSRLRGIDKQQFNRGVRYLVDDGSVKVISKNGQLFIKLTQKGELKVLVSKARMPVKGKWGGRWSLIIFDIPESSKEKRNFFRRLLKMNGFYKLQASVYISPYPLNAEAALYLKETGLIHYIRIIHVSGMDYDVDLKRHFQLS